MLFRSGVFAPGLGCVGVCCAPSGPLSAVSVINSAYPEIFIRDINASSSGSRLRAWIPRNRQLPSTGQIRHNSRHGPRRRWRRPLSRRDSPRRLHSLDFTKIIQQHFHARRIFGKNHSLVGDLRQSKSVYVVADFKPDRKSTRLNSSHIQKSRMPSSA